jgi:LmbE family N-acetylglucosaminyl deacetylase
MFSGLFASGGCATQGETDTRRAVTLKRIFGLVLMSAVLVALACAQSVPDGAAAALASRRLPELAGSLRVLQVTAHPGDEDGALLLYFSHQGAEVTLLTLTRGERGDSHIGILEPTEQGLLRTMEQLASDAHYGAEQRFTRVVDFGFARTANEVFDRWMGHDVALRDMVRVIREMRPAIVTMPFDPGAPDGDGQHEATAILVREAFRAAADAKKFPEQLKDGVEPWQAKRLFALVRSGSYTVAFNAGEQAAGEPQSWQQQAQAALDEQRSQQGLWHVPRDAVRRYRLIDSAPGYAMSEGAQKFSAGLDTRLESLADEAGLGSDVTEQSRSRLRAMRSAAMAASESAADATACASQLVAYLRILHGMEDRLLGAHGSASMRAQLETKRKIAEQVLLQLAGVSIEARLSGDAEDDQPYVLTPGADFALRVQVASAGPVRVTSIELKSAGGRWMPKRDWQPGQTVATFHGRVPMDAPFTRPHFLLESEDDGAYRILDEAHATHALPSPALEAVVEVEAAGELVRTSVAVQGSDSARMQRLMIVPPVSVIVQPRTHWGRRAVPVSEIDLKVRSNVATLGKALLTVHVPSGWRSEPEHEVLEIMRKGEEHSYRFYLVRQKAGDGAIPVRAVVRWNNQVFDQGYMLVRDAAGRLALDYRISEGRLVTAELEAAENLHVGYVGIAGDAIPEALRGAGVRVTELDRETLTAGKLEKYWAIVLGPGAVDERDDVGEARGRLLEYAKDGGAVVILGQADAERFVHNAPLPYALEVGAERVSNEASAVAMPDARDPLFLEPNEIGEDDFRGWVDERGHNFAQHWDGHFEALLRMQDASQPMQEGALLRARYGRGSVVYSGLAFSRQMEGGVPGAMRLLINLLSPSAELHR